MGFFVICAGVVLLQLSKSAKDVPDAAVFAGDLDQVRTIAEQEQPESEPKADAIRGAAAIVRRFSVTRQKMEQEEARRLHEEKMRDLEPIGENEHVEWDGLRRRRTTIGGHSMRSATPMTPNLPPANLHPPLGMSRFPTEAELQEEENRPNTALSSSFLGSFRGRGRSVNSQVQSPMHPVPLTEIAIPSTHGDSERSGYYNQQQGGSHSFGLPSGLGHQKTEYEGHGALGDDHVHFSETALGERSESRGSIGPIPPPHSARRQFSFHNVFRKSQVPSLSDEPVPALPISRKTIGSRQSSHSGVKGATEEERLGLVKGDTNVASPYVDDDDEDDFGYDDKRPPALASASAGRVVAGSGGNSSKPPRKRSVKEEEADAALEAYEQQRKKFNSSRGPSPPEGGRGSDGGAFI